MVTGDPRFDPYRRLPTTKLEDLLRTTEDEELEEFLLDELTERDYDREFQDRFPTWDEPRDQTPWWEYR